MAFNKYPYTDFHELNEDWILNEIIGMKATLAGIDKITFADPIAWSALNTYPANQIVQNAGRTYISKQNVPIGILISSEDYWLEIANMNADKIELQAEIDSINDMYSQDHYNIYVKCTNGNDDNSGLTEDAPVKTMDKAMEIMAKHAMNSAYIYMNESGSYTMNVPVIAGCQIHYMFNDTNVTLNWLQSDNSRTKAFYCTYIHFDGFRDNTSRIVLHGVNDAYFEGSRGYLVRINLFSDGNTKRFGFAGGTAIIKNSNIHVPLFFGGCNAMLVDNTYTYDPEIAPSYVNAAGQIEYYNGNALIYCYNGATLGFTRNHYIVMQSGTYTIGRFLNLSRTHLTMTTEFTDAVNGFTSNAVYLVNSTVQASWSRVAKLCNMGGCDIVVTNINGEEFFDFHDTMKTVEGYFKVYDEVSIDSSNYIQLPYFSQYMIQIKVTYDSTNYIFIKPLMITKDVVKQRIDFDTIFGLRGYVTIDTRKENEIRYFNNYVSINNGTPIGNSSDVKIEAIYAF